MIYIRQFYDIYYFWYIAVDENCAYLILFYSNTVTIKFYIYCTSFPWPYATHMGLAVILKTLIFPPFF